MIVAATALLTTTVWELHPRSPHKGAAVHTQPVVNWRSSQYHSLGHTVAMTAHSKLELRSALVRADERGSSFLLVSRAFCTRRRSQLRHRRTSIRWSRDRGLPKAGPGRVRRLARGSPADGGLEATTRDNMDYVFSAFHVLSFTCT